jgi:hypothetical protein
MLEPPLLTTRGNSWNRSLAGQCLNSVVFSCLPSSILALFGLRPDMLVLCYIIVSRFHCGYQRM